MKQMIKPLKSFVSPEFQQGVLLQLAEIRQKIEKVGPCPKWTYDTSNDVRLHREQLEELLTDARIASSVALPPAIQQELTNMSGLVRDLYIGIKEEENPFK